MRATRFAVFNPHEKFVIRLGRRWWAIKHDKAVSYFLNVDFTRRNFPMLDSLNVVSVNPVADVHWMELPAERNPLLLPRNAPPSTHYCRVSMD